MVKIPKQKFHNGYEIPAFGLGTWKSKSNEVKQAVKSAIDYGYRHIDCAHAYQNEKEVGAALADKIKESAVKREDLFITSKLWNTYHRPAVVEGICREQLNNLGLKYLDLYLIHWPMGYKEGKKLFPHEPNGQASFSDVDYIDTWKAMEKLVDLGLVRSIGVSNFNSKQLNRLLDSAHIKPVNNQIECHPYLIQKDLIAYCRLKNITVTAYSPLGSGDRPWAKTGDPKLLDDKRLKSIANNYKGKTVAQTLLRYQIQRGNIVIPKSVTPARIKENIEIFDFELNSDDMKTIDSFDCNGRFVPLLDAKTHKYYPF